MPEGIILQFPILHTTPLNKQQKLCVEKCILRKLRRLKGGTLKIVSC